MIRLLITTLVNDFLEHRRRRAAAQQPRYVLVAADSHVSTRATGRLQPVYFGSARR